MNNLQYAYQEGFKCEEIPPDIIRKITGYSYPNYEVSEISLTDLKYLTLKYYDFHDTLHHNGQLIIHSKLSQDIIEIFYILYKIKYPIEKIRLIDDYNANDELSMYDNNTSAFNYRFVVNTERLSKHALGCAIDINPLMNPYIVDGKIHPKNAARYIDRSIKFPGKIDENDLCFKLFHQYGWTWGGNWDRPALDYQHFEKVIF